jgi:hypothetical protein
MDVDFILKPASKPCMNSQLSRKCISTVLLPYIDQLRANEELADKEVVLLIENCSIRVQPETLQMLADH